MSPPTHINAGLLRSSRGVSEGNPFFLSPRKGAQQSWDSRADPSWRFEMVSIVMPMHAPIPIMNHIVAPRTNTPIPSSPPIEAVRAKDQWVTPVPCIYWID